MSDWTVDEPVDPTMLDLMYQAETVKAEDEGEVLAAVPGLADQTSEGEVHWPAMPSLLDFFARTDGPIDWLWDGMIMRGSVNIIGAYMKVGKSSLVMNMVQGLIERDTLFERTMRCSREGRVFWFASEDAERIIRYNFDHAGITPGRYINRLVLVTKGQPYLDALRADGDRDAKWDAMKAALRRDRCEVLILDTINTFSAYLGLDDENDNQKVTELMDKIAELKTEGITVVLTQHTGKNSERGGTLQSLRGASAYGALADQVMLMNFPGSDNTTTKRKLTIIGRTSVDSPPYLNLDYDKKTASYFTIADDEPLAAGPEGGLDMVERWMVKAAAFGPLTQASLRGQIGLSNDKIREAFDALREADGIYQSLRLDDRGRIVRVSE